MGYRMQVKVDGVFKNVRPSGSQSPYDYDTRLEAERMLDICYPDQCRAQRLGGETMVRMVGVGFAVAAPVITGNGGCAGYDVREEHGTLKECLDVKPFAGEHIVRFSDDFRKIIKVEGDGKWAK